MAGKGRITGGLVVCLIGILGVCLACGLPMWREGSFVGSNIVSGQMIWDGLWLHCVVQSTGQMQCKRQIGIDFTNDLQAGRAIMLLSIIVGLIGFIIVVMGGGVANCSGAPPDNYYSTRQSTSTTSSSENTSALLGGLLCVIAGILCLVSVIWSAALTATVRNDPLVLTAMKRDVGTSIYVGLGSGVLLLVGGALVCMVCMAKPSQPPPQVYPSFPTPYGYRSAPSAPSPYSQLSRMTPPRMADVTESSLVFAPTTPQYKAQPYAPPPESRAARDSFQYKAPRQVGAAEPRSASFAGTQPKQELFVQDTPSLTALLPREYYYNTPN